MSILRQNDAKKWIQGFVAIVIIIFSYIVFAFLRQLGEWFDLEAKLAYYQSGIQVAAVVLGLIAYLLTIKSKVAIQYLDEVFNELVKVVWPDRESTFKLTVGIIIGIIITSIVLGLVDFGIGKIFRLLYN